MIFHLELVVEVEDGLALCASGAKTKQARAFWLLTFQPSEEAEFMNARRGLRNVAEGGVTKVEQSLAQHPLVNKDTQDGKETRTFKRRAEETSLTEGENQKVFRGEVHCEFEERLQRGSVCTSEESRDLASFVWSLQQQK